MMKNIAVLVSGGGTNLQALIDAQNRGEIIGGKITLVVSSNPDAYALKRAENNNIATKICEKKNYKDRAEYTAAIRDILLEAKADLVVYAGFMTILDEQIVKAFPNKMMNVHPALIPSFCGEGYWGLHVHEKVIESGVKLTGATVHFVDAGTDTGPIILQKAVKVKDGDTSKELQRRVMEKAEWKILPEAINLIANDKITVTDGIVSLK